MEYRKATSSFTFGLRLAYGDTKDIDNSSDVDSFWNALKACLTATYGDGVTVSQDGNTAILKFSDFQDVVFTKEDTGVYQSPRMPFYVATDDTLYLQGATPRFIAPVVKKTGISLSGLKSKPEILSGIGVYNYSFDALLYTIIAFDIVAGINNFTYWPLKASASFTYDNLDYEYSKDDLVNILRQYGFDSVADTFSERISGDFGYLKVKSISLSYQTDGWNDVLVNQDIKSNFHFYDSGYVGEFIFNGYVAPFAILASDNLEVTLVVDIYDTNDNLIVKNGELNVIYIPEANYKLRGKFNKFTKTAFSFGTLKRNQPFEYATLEQKVSDTAPVYRVSLLISGLSVGDYIVVFSDNNYAYRTIVDIDETAGTIELDSDVSFLPSYYSNQIPDSYAISFPISEDSSSYVSGYIRWRMSYYKIISLDENYLGQSKSRTIPETEGYYLQISPATQDIYELILISDTESLKEILPPYEEFFAVLSNAINVPLPKQAVADGELTTAYLEQLNFLRVGDCYNGYVNRIIGLGLPFVIIQVGEDFKDFLGYIDFLAVYSKDFAERYPSKAFLNSNNLNEDKQAILLKKLVVGDDFSLYLSEGLITSDKLFVVR